MALKLLKFERSRLQKVAAKRCADKNITAVGKKKKR